MAALQETAPEEKQRLFAVVVLIERILDGREQAGVIVGRQCGACSGYSLPVLVRRYRQSGSSSFRLTLGQWSLL